MIPTAASRPLRREMPFEQVAARLPDWMRPHLPRKWVQLGRVLLLRLPQALEDERQPVAAAYATLPGVEAVMRRPRIGGELRQPRLPQLLLGSSAETEVREHGLRYRLDLQRVMWAPGNVGWRAGPRGPAAVAALYAHPGPRTILDCFAGIGYFALQFARHWPESRVIAVEKSPVAAEYLQRNVALNGLANVEVIENDCRDVTREADIVHLGYIGGTCNFLQHSSDCLEPSGTIIFHEVYRNNWLGFRKRSDWNGTPAKFAELMDEYGYEVEAFGRVKTYGPSSSHIVARLKKRN